METAAKYAYHLAKGIAVRALPASIIGKYLPKYRHLLQASSAGKAFKKSPPVKAAKPATILFFSPKWWGLHSAWESTIALALRQKGHRVRFLTCERIVDVCESMIFGNFGREMCLSCPAMLEDFLAKLDLPRDPIRKHVDMASMAALRRRINSLPEVDLFHFEHAGLNISDHIGCSVARHFRQLDWPHDKAHLDYYRRLLYAGALLAEALPKALDEIRPDRILMCNGKFFAEQVLMTLARNRGIDVITYERGNILGTLIFAINRPAVPFDLKAGWDVRRERPLSPEESSRLESYMGSRKKVGNGMVSFFGKDIQEDASAIRAVLKLDPSKRTFVLFSNTIWDSAVYGEDTAFTDMFAWIDHAIRHFKSHSDQQLVIRIHPAEIKVYWQTTLQKAGDFIAKTHPNLPANIKVIAPENGISSYTLMDMADAGLVYSSSVGIEMACLGKPVISAANSNYLGMGFTADARDPADWTSLVDQISFVPNPTRADLARRFAYLSYFQYMIPFPHAHEDILQRTFELRYHEPQDLESPGMELICRGILEAKPIFIRVET